MLIQIASEFGEVADEYYQVRVLRYLPELITDSKLVKLSEAPKLIDLAT